jgi:hypothetical protein
LKQRRRGPGHFAFDLGLLAFAAVASGVGVGRSRALGDGWVADAIIHPWSMRLALVAVVLSFLLPVGGLGVDLCLFHRQTGLPCPGCGLTRSLTSVAHGEIGHAFDLHLFGPAIWLIALALSVGNFLGERRRERIRTWLRQRGRSARIGYLTFVYGFVVFGVVRLVLAIVAAAA